LLIEDLVQPLHLVRQQNLSQLFLFLLQAFEALLLELGSLLFGDLEAAATLTALAALARLLAALGPLSLLNVEPLGLEAGAIGIGGRVSAAIPVVPAAPTALARLTRLTRLSAPTEPAHRTQFVANLRNRRHLLIDQLQLLLDFWNGEQIQSAGAASAAAEVAKAAAAEPAESTALAPLAALAALGTLAALTALCTLGLVLGQNRFRQARECHGYYRHPHKSRSHCMLLGTAKIRCLADWREPE
jgi:hypothetical protein